MSVVVGLRCNNSSFWHRDNGIKLILAPKSQRAFSIYVPPMSQGIKKLP